CSLSSSAKQAQWGSNLVFTQSIPDRRYARAAAATVCFGSLSWRKRCSNP
ncbi:Hypothetical predicted protein, partial [Scomber scombrus]